MVNYACAFSQSELGKYFEWIIISIIIRCKSFFVFIGREPTTWPANNCLQIMVFSCAMSSNFVWRQINFYPCVNDTKLSPSCDRSCVKMADRFASRRCSLKTKLGDRMIKQLLNSVVAKYRDLSVPRRSIICLSLRLRPIRSACHWQITTFHSTSSNNC